MSTTNIINDKTSVPLFAALSASLVVISTVFAGGILYSELAEAKEDIKLHDAELKELREMKTDIKAIKLHLKIKED